MSIDSGAKARASKPAASALGSDVLLSATDPLLHFRSDADLTLDATQGPAESSELQRWPTVDGPCTANRCWLAQHRRHRSRTLSAIDSFGNRCDGIRQLFVVRPGIACLRQGRKPDVVMAGDVVHEPLEHKHVRTADRLWMKSKSHNSTRASLVGIVETVALAGQDGLVRLHHRAAV